MKNKKQTNIFNILLLILAGFSVFLISGLSLYTWRWGDDYSIMVEINELGGLFNYLTDMYMVKGGRFAGITYSLYFSIHYFLHFKIVIFISTLLWIVSTYFINELLNLQNTKIPTNNISRYILMFFTASILWYSFEAHSGQTLYWTTGGTYTMMNLTTVLWMYIFIRKIKRKFKFTFIKLILFLILTLATASGSYISCFGALTLSGIYLIIELYKKDITNIKFIIFTLTILLIGTIILYIAPGNYVRAGSTSQANLQISDLVYNYFMTLKGWWSYSKRLTFFSLIAAGIFILYKYNLKFKKRSIKFNKNTIIELLENTKWLWVSLSTAVIFSFNYGYAVSRTSIFFMTFLFLFIVQFSLFIASKFLQEKDKEQEKQFPLWKIISIPVFILFIWYQTTEVYPKAIKISKIIDKRIEYISKPENKGKDIVVKAVPKELMPYALKFNDLEDDKTYWGNVFYAKYYKLKSIKSIKE